MTPVDASEADLAAIRAWAEPIQSIVEVWLFGSRAKRTSRPDSDFDIGVTLASRSVDGSNWALGNFLVKAKDWRLGLEAALHRHVSLEPIGGKELAKLSRSPCVKLWER